VPNYYMESNSNNIQHKVTHSLAKLLLAYKRMDGISEMLLYDKSLHDGSMTELYYIVALISSFELCLSWATF